MTKNEKTIALVAHNSEKIALAECTSNKSILKKFDLVGNQGTGTAIMNIAGLNIKPLGHEPDGGEGVIANQVLRYFDLFYRQPYTPRT